MQTNFWIMKNNLDTEDLEQYVTKIHEFAQDFFNHVNANKSDKDQSQKNASTRPRKDGVPLTRAMMMMSQEWNPPGKESSNTGSRWRTSILTILLSSTRNSNRSDRLRNE